MNRLSTLKLVENNVPLQSSESVVLSESGRNCHSLHYSIALSKPSFPEIAKHFINKYSEKGQVVLDPFCSSGTVGLEACLLGRFAILSDIDELSLKIASSKLYPAHLAEVMFSLQTMNLSSLMTTSIFKDEFHSFFDNQTFSELVSLKKFIKNSNGYIYDFIELLALSIVHGRSAGALSVETYPQLSILPEQQARLNEKLHQIPEYRSVVPRLIKKAAFVLRDGLSQTFLDSASKSSVSYANSSNLSHVSGASIDLIVTTPPLVSDSRAHNDQWIRNWLSETKESHAYHNERSSVESWLDFMNANLFEFARVIKRGSRIVLDLEKQKVSDSIYSDSLSRMVLRDLSHYYQVEAIIKNKPNQQKIRHSLKSRSKTKDSLDRTFMVLRRK